MTNHTLFPELYRYLPYWLATSLNWLCDKFVLVFVLCVLAPAAMFSDWITERQARGVTWRKDETK